MRRVWRLMEPRKKRILFIASQPYFQWRGSPIRVGFDVMALAELGYEVDLLVLPVGQDRDVPGVRVLRAPNLLFVRNVSIGPSLVKAVFDVIMLVQAMFLAGRNHYDVVHCVEDAGPIGVILRGITGCKLVFEKHSDPSSYKKGFLRNMVMWLYARVERFTVRHATAAIGTGPGLVEQVERMRFGTPAHHIFDIPSSLVEAEPGRVAAVRKRLLQSPDEVLATFVGSFAVYQGIDLLFDSMPLAVAKNPRVRFVIIGGSEAEIAARRDWLRARNIESSVTFVGKVPPDELPDYLAASDILLSPRLAGINTPLKLLDYLKAGGAIVATDTEANRLILDESNAVMVGLAAGSFADGICKLAGSADLRGTLGRAGHELVKRLYNYREFKRRLGVCYSGMFRGAAL